MEDGLSDESFSRIMRENPAAGASVAIPLPGFRQFSHGTERAKDFSRKYVDTLNGLIRVRQP